MTVDEEVSVEEYLYELDRTPIDTMTYPGEGMGWYGLLELNPDDDWVECPGLSGYAYAIIHVQFDGLHEWWLLSTKEEADEEWEIIRDQTGNTEDEE